MALFALNGSKKRFNNFMRDSRVWVSMKVFEKFIFSLKSNSFSRFTLRKSFFKNLKLEPPNKISTYRNSSRFTTQMTRIIPTHKQTFFEFCMQCLHRKSRHFRPLITAKDSEFFLAQRIHPET